MSNTTLRKSSVRANPDKQPPEVFHKKGVFENLAKFTEKRATRICFLIKLQASGLKFHEKTGSDIAVFL